MRNRTWAWARRTVAAGDDTSCRKKCAVRRDGAVRLADRYSFQTLPFDRVIVQLHTIVCTERQKCFAGCSRIRRETFTKEDDDEALRVAAVGWGAAMNAPVELRLKDECPTDGKNSTVLHRVLHEACLKVGGEHALAARLGWDVDTVHSWLRGHATPPDSVFLKCLDILGLG